MVNVERLFKLLRDEASSASPTLLANTAPLIVNLSRLSLDPPSVNLLNKGLSFIPTPPSIDKKAVEFGILRLKNDLIRNLTLGSSRYSRTSSRYKTLLKKTRKPMEASTLERRVDQFTTKHKDHVTLTDTFREIDEIMVSFKGKTPRSNIHSTEALSLRYLSRNNDIIIKKADKGSTTVILDKDLYVKEVERQLNDPSTYKKIDKPLNVQTKKIINNMVDFMAKKKYISHHLKQNLGSTDNFQDRYFYILPKIHKNPEDWTIPNLLPKGRPIISGVGSEMSDVCKYVDFVLQPFVKKLPSYIQSTEHILALLEDFVCPSQSILFTLDVVSLYTNIATDRGIDSITEILTESNSNGVPVNCILTLLRNCLIRNDFIFNKNRFLQINGTAMGCAFAPSYANLFMGQLEKRIYLLPEFSNIILWKRFIDDILAVWTGTREDLQRFVEVLNSIDDSITFTLTLHETEINFLDVTIFKDPTSSRLLTKMFFKDTDSKTLIHKKSFHPKGVHKSVVKTQIFRYARRSSRKDDFDSACSALFSSLRNQEYSRTFLRNLKKEALMDMGLHGDMWQLGFFHCGVQDCLVCTFGVFGRRTETDPPYLISQNITCRSTHVVYAISCKDCGVIYIGQTSRSLRTRILNHLGNIRKRADHPLAKHFHTAGHDREFFTFQGLYKITPTADVEMNTKRLLKIENQFMTRFETVAPLGVNILNFIPQPIPLVLPYSPEVAHMGYKIFKALEKSGKKIRLTFTRHPNLRSILVNRKLS